MNRIFFGLLLVFINFNLDIGASRIGLVPDFLGYIFMLRGTAELIQYSSRFEKTRPYITAMIGYTLILYVLDLFGFSRMGGVGIIGVLLGFASLCASLYISFNIVMGVKDIEIMRAQDLNGDKLLSIWKLQAVMLAAVHFLIIIPPLAIICMLTGFLVTVYFLVVFYRTKGLFYEMY